MIRRWEVEVEREIVDGEGFEVRKGKEGRWE